MAPIKAIAAGLLCVGALWGCASTPADAPANPAKPYATYTQAASGMRYPAMIRDYKRVAVTRYNEDGTDESVGYNRVTPGTEISATIYVYPSPAVSGAGAPELVAAERARKCGQQFQAALGELTIVHRDAVLISDGDVVLRQAGARYAGHKTVHKYAAPFDFFGRAHAPLMSETYMFCFVGGFWTVEYRIDYPRDYDAHADIAAFMHDLRWTIRRGGSRAHPD